MPLPTRLFLLTPAGRGAIASFAVEGPRALEAVAGCFRPASGLPLANIPLHRIAYGRWSSAAGEEELVVRRRASDRIEIHCHGGEAVPQAIVAALAERNVREAPWDEWLGEQTADPLQAAAAQALARARTERAAAILLDQYRGALREEIERIVGLLRASASSALGALQALLERGPLGLHLAQPWRVVLAGKPNVGKSSLINRLVGYERAIVFDRPGTTRDVLTAATAIEGWPVELSDTAGLRGDDDAADELERAGMARTREQLAAADLAIFVTAADDLDQQPGCLEQPGCSLVVINKCDLHRAAANQQPGCSKQPDCSLFTSALTGEGIDALLAAIAARLVPHSCEPGMPVPFTETQIAALRQVLSTAEGNDFLAAANILQRLLAVG